MVKTKVFCVRHILALFVLAPLLAFAAGTADLSVLTTPSTYFPIIGQQVTLQLVLSNSGPGGASGVIVTNYLSPGLQYVSSTGGGANGTYNSGSGIWSVPSVAANSFVSISVTVNATTAGYQTNEVSVGEFGGYASDTAVLSVSPPEATFYVQTTPTPEFPYLGEQIVFQLLLTNAGPDTINSNITVTNFLTSGLQYDSNISGGSNGTYNAGTGIWTVPGLAAGSAVSISVTTTAIAPGYQTNEVLVGDFGGYYSDTSVLEVVQPEADLAVTTTPSTYSPIQGQNVNFLITLTNDGPDDVTTSIPVTNFLSSGLQYLTDTSGGAYNHSTGIWTVPGLAAGSGLSMTLTATATGLGEQTNLVTVGVPSGYIDPNPGNNSAYAFPYISQPQADIGVTTTASSNNLAVGQPVTFLWIITNAGPNDINTRFTVTNFLSAGLQYVSDTSGGAYNPTTGILTFTSLLANSSISISLVATATVAGIQTNTITAGVPPGYNDPNLANNTSSAFVNVTNAPQLPQADLAISQTVGNPQIMESNLNTVTVTVGQYVVFTLNVTNYGPSFVSNSVIISDLLPPGLQYVSYSSSLFPPYFGSGNWANNSGMASGESGTLTITALATNVGTFTNTSMVTASGINDPNLANNTSSTVLQVRTAQSDLALGLLATTNAPTDTNIVLSSSVITKAGAQIIFVFGLTNYGPDAINGPVTVSNFLPAGFQFVSSSAGTYGDTYNPTNGVWTIPEVSTLQQYTLNIAAVPTNTGIFTNTAIANVPPFTVDPNLTNNTASVVITVVPPQADLAIGVTASTNAAIVGQQVTFTVFATNLGPDSVVSPITITDVLLAGFQYVTNIGFVPYNPTNGTWTLSGLGSTNQLGMTFIGYIVATAVTPGSYTNTATIQTTPGIDPNLANNTSSVGITVRQLQCDLAVTKNVFTNVMPVFSTFAFNFTVTVTNNGPDTVSNVTVTDLLPPGLPYSGVLTNLGSSYTPGTGLWALSSPLAAGQGASINILGLPANPGTFTNVATVNVPTNFVDTNPNNNTASAVVTVLPVYRILGYVGNCTSNGVPLANVTVTITGATNLTLLTPSSGNFSFDNLYAGTYTITPTQPGNNFTPPSVTVTVSNAWVTLPQFVGGVGLIYGQLFYGNNPITNQPVTIAGPGFAKPPTALTDVNGYYIFTNLGIGQYTITPVPTNGYIFTNTNAVITLNATNCAAFTNFYSLPRVVQLVAMEVTQVIQDWSNSVPLISAKRTYLRCHFQLPPGSYSPPVLLVGARVYGPGIAPLQPLNTNGQLLIQTTNAGSVRANWNSSLNFEVPFAWCSGVTSLQFLCTNNVTVVPTNTVAVDSSVTVSFTPAPILPLKMYAWNWTNAGTVQYMSQAAFADLPKRLVSMYPVPDVTAPSAILVPPASLAVPLPIPPAIAVTEKLPDWILLLSNSKLAALQAIDTLLGGRFGGGGARFIYYGAIAGPTPPGGTVGWAKATISPSNTVNNSGGLYVSSGFIVSNFYTIDRHTHSHEIGHNLGRPHDVMANRKGVCMEGAPAGTPVYPFFQTVAGATKPAIGPMTSGTNSMIYGLDTLTLNTTTMNAVVDPGVYFDVMSYCDVLPLDVWISPYTYLALRTNITSNFSPPATPPAAGPPRDIMYARGYIDPSTDAGGFLPSWTTKTTSTNDPPGSIAGTYEIEVYDSNGNLTEQVSFSLDQEVVEDGDIDEYAEGEFTVPLPVVTDMHQIQLVDTLLGNQVIATMTAPADIPSVTAVSLLATNGLPFNGVGPMNITWTSSDANSGAQLYYTIQYSTDGGNTWENIDMDLVGNSYQIDSTYFPASTQALIRVLASDGYNTSTPMNSSLFVMPSHPPVTTINTPTSGSIYTVDQQIVLDATANDPQDGLLDGASVQWTSSLDGSLGEGAQLFLAPSALSEGSHIINVTATDAEGLSSSAHVQIFVLHSPQPQLSIDVNENGQLEISWPSSLTNFVLWTSTDLASGVWTQVTTPPVAAYSTQTVTVNTTQGLQFFQLRMQ